MCVFCKIIEGAIPSYKIYEDEKCLAILDISQATLGHTLVLPKKHFDDIFDIDEETVMHLAKIVNKIAKHYAKVLPDIAGINILNNNREKAGQTVMHYHIHIIPRYLNDDLVDMKFTDHSQSSCYQELLDKKKL